jgi:glc operon protein GlcG
MRLKSLASALIATLFLTAASLDAQQPGPIGPTLADAKKMLAAAQAAATKMGIGLSCVVLDSRGSVVALERMDNAPYFTADVARGKAVVTAAFGAPSGALASLATSGIGSVLPGPIPPLFLQGAVPIMKTNQRLGAIGCSGGQSQQDEDAAKAGAATLQ